MLKFANNHSVFYTDLKSRVNEYFRKGNISKQGNNHLYFKATLFIVTFITLYIILVFYTPISWLSLLLCCLLGVCAAGIGFNIMHDGGHGSFSKNKTVNRFGALTLNLLGGSSFMWNIKHNQLHHTFTNVEGHDDDIENEPFIRMQKSQRRLWFQRFQHYYWIVIYGFMYLAWVFYLDFMKYFSRSIGAKKNLRMNPVQQTGFWATKLFFCIVFIVIPLMMMPISHFITGFLVFTFTTGIIISVVFQLAHSVEGPEFIMVDEHNSLLENDWAAHQVKTTANFATHNRIIAFLTGGLNHQIEHHLFPLISHVHYPKISQIVKSTCKEHKLPYYEYPTLSAAIASHVRFLKRMGDESWEAKAD